MRSCLDTDINTAYSLQFETTSKQTVHIKGFQVIYTFKHKTVKANDKIRHFGVVMTPLSR